MSLADRQLAEVPPRAADALFPLPLTVIEGFMVADDQADYPMLCDLQINLQGCIQREAFDAGLAFALARNPLFTCLVEPRPKAPPVWVRSTQSPPVDWAAWGTPLGPRYGERIDLAHEPGLRIWVRAGAEQSSVLLHFHHACSDGLGGYGFIEDLLAGYAEACPGGSTTRPREVDDQKLLGRGDMATGPDTRSTRKKISDTWFGIREGIKFFTQVPRPLAAPPASPAANHTVPGVAIVQVQSADGRTALEGVSYHAMPSTGSGSTAWAASATAAGSVSNIGCAPTAAGAGYLTAVCSERILAGLRRAATAAGVTVNDILLRDLLLVLRRWNDDHGASPRTRVRILMPQNLRDRTDRTLPATNRMSFAFLTRAAADCDHPDRLLQTVHLETEAIGRFKLSLCFLGSIAAILGLGLLPWLLRRPMCFATAVLSNLGDPARRFVARFERTAAGLVVGNLIFEGITGGPPLRPGTRAVFCVFSGPRTLSICCKADPRHFSPADRQALVERYAARLIATAAGHAAPDPAPVAASALEVAEQPAG